MSRGPLRHRPAAQATATSSACVAPACASLPSSDAAYRAMTRGSPGDWLAVVASTLLRGVLIASALAVYDRRDPKLLPRAAAGALGIEVFVLAYTAWKIASAPPVTTSA